MVAHRMPRDPEDPRVRVAARTVRALLMERDLLLKDLDALSGQAIGYGSQVLTGNVRLTFHHVFKWLDALEVSPDEFFRRLANALTAKPRQHSPAPEPEELDDLVDRVATELVRRGETGRSKGARPRSKTRRAKS
jgi:hypothetical protein